MSGQDDSVTIYQVVDVLMLRREQTTDLNEYEALNDALAVVENYALREQRTIGMIGKILDRLHGRGNGRIA